MACAFGFALVCCLSVVGLLNADIPLPSNLKYIDPRVQFQGIEDYPDHIFYLRFKTFSGGPGGDSRLIKVKDSQPFPLNAQRRLMYMSLLAMDRKKFTQRAQEDPGLTWLKGESKDVLSALVQEPSTVAPASITKSPVTSYRVSLKDNKLSVERLPDDQAIAGGGAWLDARWGIGIGQFGCLAGLGVWFARRGQRSR
jgi:hypothetical protein